MKELVLAVEGAESGLILGLRHEMMDWLDNKERRSMLKVTFKTLGQEN